MKLDLHRTVLFWVFLLIFVAAAVLVLLSLIGYIQIDESYKKWMFSILIVDVIGYIFSLWKQLNTSFSTPPDIAGKWEYECVRDNELDKHGGICTFTVQKSNFGWEFSIHGQRTWEAAKKDDKWEKKILEAPCSWDSLWGAFCSNDELRYFYSINTSGKVNQGFGDLNITEYQDKKPSVLEGNFGLLPPAELLYGSEKYTRINNAQ